MREHTLNPVSWIKKRDQKLQEFDPKKVERAIGMAFCDERPDHIPDIRPIAEEALKNVRFDGDNVADIEAIQDSVEKSLMAAGHHDVAKAYILYRHQRDQAREIRQTPDNMAMADYIHVAKYARYREADERREIHEETVGRVEDMHIGRFPELEDQIREAMSFVYARKVLPSMRALEDSTPIITKFGWKNAGDVIKGDILYDSSGKETTVKDVVKFQDKELYRLVFSDRSEILACDEHLWIVSTLDDMKEAKSRVVTTEFIRTHLKQGDRANITIFNPKPVERQDADLPLDPYVLGHWLGDGSKLGYQIAISEEDAPFITEQYAKAGYTSKQSESSNIHSYTVHGLAKDLREINVLDNKHIPRPYLQGSIDQRIALLQGLMDSDGCITEAGRSQFTNTDLRIIEGVEEILSSLGIKYTSWMGGTKAADHHKDLYTLGFFTSLPVFRLPRKAARLRQEDSKRTIARKVHMVESAGKGNATCFHVDSSDHSFLAGRKMIVTHNSMQFAGPPALTKNERIYNCSYALVDRPRVFQEAFYLLLCGAGVGFSVQWHHVNNLPPLKTIDKTDVRHYTIPDSIEGWSDSLGELIQSYIDGYYVEFNYSLIRAEGAVVRSGGKAPGHIPLREALDNIRGVLSKAQGRQLRPIECHDMICYTAEAVLAGGIRRSSLISLFSADDGEMMRCKAPENFRPSYGKYDKGLNDQRQLSNNSAVFVRGEVDKQQFTRLMELAQSCYGEPGFFFTNHPDYGTNPCFHPDTRIATEAGLVRIKDLYSSGLPVNVIADDRATAGDDLVDGYGVSLKKATQVELTQVNADVYELKTEHGHIVKATGNHEFLTTTGRKKLEDIRARDVLLLQSGEGSFGKWGTRAEGRLLGLVAGDGTFSRRDDREATACVDLWEDDFSLLDGIEDDITQLIDSVPSNRGGRVYKAAAFRDVPNTSTVAKKRLESVRLYRWIAEQVSSPESLKTAVPDCVFQGSREAVVGYLQGLFAADGTVFKSGEGSKASVYLRLSNSELGLLRGVQKLLQNFGITSRIYEERRPAGKRLLPDGKGGKKLYECRADHELNLNRVNAARFEEVISLWGPKADKLGRLLDERGRTSRQPERYISKVRSVTYAGRSDVFCLNQPDTHIVTGNGVVTGNCGEIGLNPRITGEEYHDILEEFYDDHPFKDGEFYDDTEVLSGFSFCNLCEINVAALEGREDFLAAAKAAAFIGTLQASFNHFPYLGRVTEIIQRREALLGVGLTGMADNPRLAFDPFLQRKAAAVAVAENQRVSHIIGIRPAARVTTVKPSGTASVVLGVVGSGVHPHHARRYFRRITANPNEAPAQFFRKHNPHMVETKPNGDWSIIFPVEAPAEAVTVKEEPALDFLARVFSTYENWVRPGTVNASLSPGLSHNVSCTVTVRDSEVEDVIEEVWENRHRVAAMAFAPLTLDKTYPFAPREEVMTPEDEEKWNRLISGYRPVDWTAFHEKTDATAPQSEIACGGGGSCEIT